MAFIYAERLLEYAIRIGIEDLKGQDAFLDRLFFADPEQNLGTDLTPPGGQTPIKERLPTDEFIDKLKKVPPLKEDMATGGQVVFRNSIPNMDDIKAYLSAPNMALRHGFPRETQDLPGLFFTLGNEDEYQYLGDRVDRYKSGDGRTFNIVGSDWDTQYNIHIMTPNYDETVLWYFILKYALKRYRPALEAFGLREQKLSFGDPEPAPEYLQAGMFVYQRTCTLSCKKVEDVPVEITDEYNELSFNLKSKDSSTDTPVNVGPETVVVPDDSAPSETDP